MHVLSLHHYEVIRHRCLIAVLLVLTFVTRFFLLPNMQMNLAEEPKSDGRARVEAGSTREPGVEQQLDVVNFSQLSGVACACVPYLGL